jgi:predicted lipoprotein with Yx(FWY)xxD motif
MRNPRTILAVVAMTAGATVGGSAFAATTRGAIPKHPLPSMASAKTASTRAATLHTATAVVRGTSERILVNSEGDPLYIYRPDTTTKSLVTGELADLWPPLVARAPTVKGATGRLTVVATTNGRQVAYNGHFLYTFLEDTPGHVTGQGEQDFFVATPTITDNLTAVAHRDVPTTGGSYGY